MGVTGLWKLLDPTGRPVTLESLEGKVLAVDVSIWLNQAMYGMPGVQGSTRANAHLIVLFNRICKLLYYKIKPIFVFDGTAPELKKHTLNARRKRKELAVARSQRAADRIVKNYLKSHALNSLSGGSRKGGRKPNLSRMLPKSTKESDIFELPPLPEDHKNRTRTILDEKEDMYLDRIDQQQAVEAQYEDLNDIDINSKDFQDLPEEIQHQVIMNIRESRKKSFWSRFRELPKKADDFSNYQLVRLLKKGKMSHRLDQLQKDMATKTSGDLAVLLDYETRLQAFEAGRVASEDTQHYILIKKKQEMDERESGEKQEEFEPDESIANGSRVIDLDDVYCQQSSESCLPFENKALDIMSSSQEGNSKGIDEKNRREAIKHEVLKFFNQQNSKRHEGNAKLQPECMLSTLILEGRNKKTVIIDEEEFREGAKRKMEETVEVLPKKIKVKEVENIEEVVDIKMKEKKESRPVRENAKRAVGGGFIGEAELNLSDEYDSDEEMVKVGGLATKRGRNIVQVEEGGGTNSRKENNQSFQGNISGSCTDKRKHLDMMGVANQKDLQDLPRTISVETNLREVKNIENKIVKEAEEEVTILDEHEEREEIVMREDDQSIDVEIETSRKKLKETEDEIMILDEEPEPHDDGKLIGRGGEIIMEERKLDQEPQEAEIEEISAEKMSGEENSKGTIEVKLTGPPAGPRTDDLFPSDLFEETSDKLDQPSTSGDFPVRYDQEQLESIQDNLDAERFELEKEKGKDQRLAASVTEAMYEETKELLRLFGIPYIESPQEAEAQCAFLDLSDQCQGIITDDSDVWLFGGQKVYKNFFTKDKEVLFYHDQTIERQLTLDRCKLINLALLMGSDYTIGIQGVGFVTAMEIISEFPGDGIQGLQNFRKWWEANHDCDKSSTESKIRSKLRKLLLTSDFPSQVVVRAYLDPEIDKSKEKFTWDSPDLDLLRMYAQEKLGWIQGKTDELLLPVLKRWREKVVQGKINSYFFLKPNVDREREKIKSKRVQEVLQKLSNPESNRDSDEDNLRQGGDKMFGDKERNERKSKTGNERKQSKGAIKRSEKTGETEMVDNISESEGSEGEWGERVAVAGIARRFENDRGRHVWLGRNNQRKLFAKNNKGIGRSWKKHDWNNVMDVGSYDLRFDDDDVNLVEEERQTSPLRQGTSGEGVSTVGAQNHENEEKTDSYWEDQISDTEYDVDEMIKIANSNVAGKMIGGSRAGMIMTNLEQTYEEKNDVKESGGKRSGKRTVKAEKEGKERRNPQRRKKGTVVEEDRSQRGNRSRREMAVDVDSDDDGRMTRGGQGQRQRRSRGRRGYGRGGGRESHGAERPQYEDEEEYRIEDEIEPERNMEETRLQAKNKARRNPYLKRQGVPGGHLAKGNAGKESSSIGQGEKIVGRRKDGGDEKKNMIDNKEDALGRNCGKGAEGRSQFKKCKQKEHVSSKVVLETRNLEKKNSQRIPRVKGRSGVASNNIPPTSTSRVNDKTNKGYEQRGKAGRNLRAKRNYFEGGGWEGIRGIRVAVDPRHDSDYDSGVDEEIDKDSGVDDGEDFSPRKIPKYQRGGALVQGNSGRGKRKGKGKQLLNKKTKFKSKVSTFTGPNLSESSSSDED